MRAFSKVGTRRLNDTHISTHLLHVLHTLSSNFTANVQPHYPKAPWVRSDDRTKLNDGASLPQTIAHRGYKAKFPENTMSAFTHAVNVGSHGLETDLHLSKDGVVVLSHVRR